MLPRIHDNNKLENIWKDALLIETGHYLSSFLEKTEKINKTVRTFGIPAGISRIQLYRAKLAHTVRGDFVIISELMLLAIRLG
jgi:hypothetical protein